ncbi:MBL fold metallo-hydrolase [Brevibacillus borstelensis]|jgi:glyoxylase-like metal-dependent hydrolase (beta-lactamase superfamily II)|uniref:MBL fold metallo-hydrolase n=1 Tax=Brevibacillus borstelensis TaxID=45462 RepID=UPI0015627378|nr:MBL fold metallo-hydrolase [Brevibacillus borstelensis]MBE5397259.1 MBL fold metallo-hydrolase [Brevibacillus borstelensis]MCM3592942.1 MBL fold metallo-hydrolase [Brevibacillus borstelensis]MED2010183.1 MBL fold metallo-hydrolase [Brevibacillus borstelensis]
MKVERISEHIWSIRSWMLIPVHVWAVADEEGVTLVDAGMPFMAKGIENVVDQLGAGPLRRILLTHGHSDHTGSVKALVERRSIPVYAHRTEIPYMEGQLPYPRRKKAEKNVTPGLAQALGENEHGQLMTVAGLRPYLTPGHSPGHVVYFHEEDQVLLAGDLFTSKKGKLHRPMPMFTADMGEAIQSSAIVRELAPRRLEVCHGGHVMDAVEQLDAYMEKTARAYSVDLRTS